jgi:hypothetical protein
MKGSGGLDLLHGDRVRAANKAWQLIEKLLAGLDSDAGADVAGLRQQIDAELARVAAADQRLDVENRRCQRPAQRRNDPESAAEKLFVARTNLNALTRALVCLPGGCAAASTALRQAIATQLLAIMDATNAIESETARRKERRIGWRRTCG